MRKCIVLLLLFASQVHSKSIQVVTNSNALDKSLSKAQVRNAFLGTPIQQDIKPVQLKPGHPLRRKFNASVVGMTESRISAYWAQMRFSGTRKPPLQLDDEKAVIQYLLDNDGVIAYLPVDTALPKGISVVFEL